MTTYSFTIPGNYRDRTGNPTTYKRVLKQAMREDAAEYLLWQQYVRALFFDLTGIARYNKSGKLDPPIVLGKGEHAQVGMKVFWRDRTHGDLDNVLKGILDALFKNDKGINGFSCSCEMAPDGKGRVEVIISISE